MSGQVHAFNPFKRMAGNIFKQKIDCLGLVLRGISPFFQEVFRFHILRSVLGWVVVVYMADPHSKQNLTTQRVNGTKLATRASGPKKEIHFNISVRQNLDALHQELFSAPFRSCNTCSGDA